MAPAGRYGTGLPCCLSQRGLRLRGGRNAVSPLGKQQAELGVAFEARGRADCELPGPRDVSLLLRPGALGEGDNGGGGDQRDRQAAAGQNQTDAPAADGALAGVLGAAGCEERALSAAQLGEVVLRPPCKARTTVKKGVVAFRSLPLLAGLGEASMDEHPFPVAFDPAPEAWPSLQQRLVRDLDKPRSRGLVAAGGEEPLVRQRVNDGLDAHGVVLQREELLRLAAPPRVLRALAGLHEPEKNPLGEAALLLGEPAIDGLRMLRQGALNASALDVGLERQQPPTTASPDLQQDVLEQRQRARAVADVGQHRLNQARFESETDRPRRLFDCPSQSLRTKGSDQQLLEHQEVPQSGVGSTPGVEVRPQRG